jgi:NADH-quinone oxidoreductase subunit M
MQTLALILLPFLAALLVFILNHKSGRMVSLIAATAELILSLNVLMQFQRNDSIQFGFSEVWIESIGLNFSIGLDGISLLLILLTTTLTPFIILSTFNKQQQNPSSFYGLILLMQSALIGVFTAQDGLLFYLFWEMALIPI